MTNSETNEARIREGMQLIRRHVRAYMEAEKLSKSQLAERVGLHRGTVRKVLNDQKTGYVAPPDVIRRLQKKISALPADTMKQLIELSDVQLKVRLSQNAKKARKHTSDAGRTNISDPKVRRGAELFHQRLREDMEQRGIEVVSLYCAALEISEKTLGRYLREDSLMLPTSSLLDGVRERVKTITDEDAEVIRLARSRQSSLSRTTGYRSRRTSSTANSSQPGLAASSLATATAETAASPLSREAQHDLMWQHFAAQLHERNGKLPKDYLSLLTGNSLDSFQVGGMPYILTPENFSAINVAGWTPEERQHFANFTSFVLERARMCLVLLAQFHPDQLREELAKQIGNAADLLWGTFKAASSVAPIEYVDSIRLERRCVGDAQS